MSDEPDVLTRVEGSVGRISLNRPKAIHALNLDMCRSMTEALLAWKDDPQVRLVVLDHTGERGFCAGGDIRRMTESRDGSEAVAFFGTEYRLNHLLFTYPKPILAFMAGITMGGGVGIAQPASYRVAIPKTMYAMPETGIGLFPDVGGGWYLPRLPGRIGVWLALTGARLNGEDCLAVGIATHLVPAEALDAVKAEILARPEAIDAILSPYRGQGGELAHRGDIDRLFAGDTVEAILAALEADGGEWALAQRDVLSKKSPSSLKISLRQMQEGAQVADFAEEMAMEYRMVLRVAAGHDFREGVRALLIDRDNDPKWSPPTVDAVTEEMVAAAFAPLPRDEEWKPLQGL